MGLDNPIHLLLLLVIVLLVSGAKRLPEMGRSLGGGLRGFKDAISNEPAAHDEPGVRSEASVQHLDAAPEASAGAAAQTTRSSDPAPVA